MKNRFCRNTETVLSKAESVQETIIELKDLTKRYPGVTALDHIQLKVQKGTVHALVGENGAGKSTLIKAIAGAIRPDGGVIVYNGREYSSLDPRMAIDLGIGVIYQEFNLVPYLTVADNIFLGAEPVVHGHIDEKECERRSREILDNLGIDIDPKVQVRDISVGYQQMTEIAKAVCRNAKLLIMDEPTATLSGKEVEALMQLVKRLKEKGISVIYISHRLEEIFGVADEVTIMRDGKYIGTLNIAECSRPKLISMMVGREMGEEFPSESYKTREAVLEVEGLTNEKIKDVSFTLYKGEILGFAGLVGAGRTELVRAIFGADSSCGSMKFFNRKYNASSPEAAVKNGIALITEDRKQQGLFMNLSVRENISMASINSIMKWWPHLDMKKDKAFAEDYKNQLSIKTPTIEQKVSNLSGGNQQKVVLAKWLLTNSKIIIFDEPTRGIDVGVKFEIYQIMKNLTKQGISIIMVSSELPEIIGISDRILVMKNGRISGELLKEEATQEKILNYAFN